MRRPHEPLGGQLGMTDQARFTTQLFGVAPLILSAALLWPATGTAQDYRTDDPPEAAQTTSSATPPIPRVGLFTEPKLLTNGIQLAIDRLGSDTGQVKSGWYLEMSNMITG